MEPESEVGSKDATKPTERFSWLAPAGTLLLGVCIMWRVWTPSGMVGFYQQFMTLKSAARWAVPLKLLECVPLLIPLPALFLVVKRKRFALLVYAGCLGFFLLCLPWLSQIGLLRVLQNPYDNRPFEAQVWRAQRGSIEPMNPRGLMIRDLLANHLSAGVARHEVVQLLGDPDWQGEPGDSLPSITYVIGLYSGILDHEFLTLHFDADGKLVSAYVREG
jgi:hypothetical protein